MVQVYNTENEFGKGEVRSWASLLDENCLNQATAISRVPIVEGYLALMPDAHFGFGPPVGSALKTRDAIMPYAVGVDIGCGMIAVRTQLTSDRVKQHGNRIMKEIRERIPSGVGKAKLTPSSYWYDFLAKFGTPPGVSKHAKGGALVDIAAAQFGTLGSGNHFVEVCEDAEGIVWLVLHSGSRGVGNQLATMHYHEANELMPDGIENKEFAWFHRWQPEYQSYIDDMLYCQQYAFHQREAMMKELIKSVANGAQTKVEVLEKINCHHNYAEEIEPGLWLTRKGAIDASIGKGGIIPGSMGAATHIVEGLGNEESYNTSPHGAGRLLGRNVARKLLDINDFKGQMAGKTWLDRDAETLLDEAPQAYKPIEVVIEDSKDLVNSKVVLSQFINYKGV